MQTQKVKESFATEKQRKFIQSLRKRGFVDFEVNELDLTVKEASAVIDAGLALAKEAALSDEIDRIVQEGASEEVPLNSSQREEFNKIRFGMCAKLVYSKRDHNLESNQGVKNFRNEIQRLYEVLSEMERSLTASFSLSRVELLHQYMKKNNRS